MTFYEYNPVAREKKPLGNCVRMDLANGGYIEVTTQANGVSVRMHTNGYDDLVIRPIVGNVVEIIAVEVSRATNP